VTSEPIAAVAIERAVLAIEPTVSASRAKQVRWVAGELRRALERADFPAEAASSLRALLAPGPVARYLELAAAQQLTAMDRAPRRASVNSLLIRRQCLGLIAQAAGVPFDPPQLPQPDLLPAASGQQRTAMWRYATTIPATRTRTSYHAHVRLGALVGVVLDTGARVGELLTMRLVDLGPDLETLIVRRAPQHRDTGRSPAPDVCLVDEPTRRALRRYLESRAELLAPHTGTDHGMLWVAANGVRAKRGETSYAKLPGMALTSKEALIKAYRLAAHRVNAAMAGHPDWQPLPTGLEQLRRSSNPTSARQGVLW